MILCYSQLCIGLVHKMGLVISESNEVKERDQP